MSLRDQWYGNGIRPLGPDSTWPRSVEESDRLELLTPAEVAELIHVTPQWVRSQCRKQCKAPMPHMKRGGRLFFEERAVLNWFRQGTVK